MNNLGEQINQVLNNLASKFGVTVDKLYPILRKQAQVDLVRFIVVLIGSVILLYSVYKIRKRVLKSKKENEYYDLVDDDLCYFIYTIFALILGIIGIFVSIHNIIQISINPDYYIAKMIMQMIKDIK